MDKALFKFRSFISQQQLWPFLTLVMALVIGAALRLQGIHWGIPTLEFPIAPLHPDEKWGMNVIAEMNWSLGDFNPQSAHSEGALSYYLWSGTCFLLTKLGLLQGMPWDLAGNQAALGDCLLVARLLNIGMDLASILLVSLITRRITNSYGAGAFAALVFAIIPFEVIYAHYMRTHIPANFFMLLTIFLTTKLYYDRQDHVVMLVGFCSGFATATRYPIGAIAIVPALVLLNHSLQQVFVKKSLRLQSELIVLSRRMMILAVSLILGFFIADPLLFLQFSVAEPHLYYLTTWIDKGQFDITSLYNLDKLWRYVVYLIPYGQLPFLWILFYSAIIYLIFRPYLYRYSLPLLGFLFFYFYSMAKGYTTLSIFIRPTLALNPFFAILLALMLADLSQRFGLRSRIFHAFAAITITTIALSLIFDIAYTNAMQKEDPRVSLFRYLDQAEARPEITVGTFPDPHNFITIKPPLVALTSPRVDLEVRQDLLENPGTVDYVVFSSFESEQHALIRERANNFINSAYYEFVDKYRTPITFFGYEFNNENFPHDLQYPFPTVYLFRRKNLVLEK